MEKFWLFNFQIVINTCIILDKQFLQNTRYNDFVTDLSSFPAWPFWIRSNPHKPINIYLIPRFDNDSKL